MPSLRSVCAAAFVVPCVAAAQTAVSGVVRDSLSGRPFAGATVQLVSSRTPWDAGRSATTDATGRYVIADVAPGRYTVGFLHARLDSLGLDAVSRTIDVRATPSVRMDLALPSAATLATSLCGARRDSTGVLVGRVFDVRDDAAPLNATIRVRWAEFVFDSSGMHRAEGNLTAGVGRDGRYVACGVPVDVPVLLSAVVDDTLAPAHSGEIEIDPLHESRLVHRDLLVAADSAIAATSAGARLGRARLAGRVFTPSGRALANARVSVPDAGVDGVSDASGQYHLANLPAGTPQVTVIAIGYAPTRIAVDLRPDRETDVDLHARARVATLETNRVFADAESDHAGFYQRRARGSGVYLTSADIERKGAYSVGAALIGVPSLHWTGTDPETNKPAIVGRFSCKPVYFLDGVKSDLTYIDGLIGIGQIGAIEVYSNPTEAPAQFAGPAASITGGATKNLSALCSAVLVWTKTYVP